MAALLLRVCLTGFDPPRVRPFGRSRWSSGIDSCYLLGAVRLGFLVMWRDLVSDTSDLCKGSMAMTAAPGHWSLGARARRLPGCHRQGQAGSGRGATTAMRRRLVLAAVVVVRWSQNLDVIFIIFEMFCTSDQLL
jgi:hypothetical protein